jgi:hypothetical protein
MKTRVLSPDVLKDKVVHEIIPVLIINGKEKANFTSKGKINPMNMVLIFNFLLFAVFPTILVYFKVHCSIKSRKADKI